jgi:hypothetical protein
MAVPASAINIVIDYTYDTNNFFGNGNPQGATAGMQAKAALEAAAGYYSSILNDTFSAITIPPPYHSTRPGSTGVVSWLFEEHFQHPTTGVPVVVSNPTVAADAYVVYVGARSLSGITAGIGGIGGYQRGNQLSGTNSFTQADEANLDTIDANFFNSVDTRGEPTGFSRWGGAISFDSDASPQWHFNHTTSASGNVRDFYSVAIHELGHTLGFGVTSEWNALVSGSFFDGGNAKLQNGGSPVPLSPDVGHWANGTMSVVYGDSIAQEAAMDPDLQNGARKRLTALDAAALKDIGWEVIAPPPPTGIDGDYNDNDIVDAADYVVWRERLNQSVMIPNDASPGSVTVADYSVWRNNFGRVPGSGSAVALSAVTEPRAANLASVGVV